MNESKLEEYRQLKNQLTALKDAEMDLRIEICEELGIANMAAGTHNQDFEDAGLAVKMVKKLNNGIDRALLEDLVGLFSEEEAECIAYDPRLKLTEYRKCSNTDFIDQVIVTKPAPPSLDVILKDFS